MPRFAKNQFFAKLCEKCHFSQNFLRNLAKVSDFLRNFAKVFSFFAKFDWIFELFSPVVIFRKFFFIFRKIWLVFPVISSSQSKTLTEFLTEKGVNDFRPGSLSIFDSFFVIIYTLHTDNCEFKIELYLVHFFVVIYTLHTDNCESKT